MTAAEAGDIACIPAMCGRGTSIAQSYRGAVFRTSSVSLYETQDDKEATLWAGVGQLTNGWLRAHVASPGPCRPLAGERHYVGLSLPPGLWYTCARA